MTNPVDVLIIGAGASGAALAWSLAETKMHILCLEQGDWMKPSEYPSAARDWKASVQRFPHQPESSRSRYQLPNQRRRLADQDRQL
jgi:choline dehydrogenase-like flavoprotein